MLACKLVNRTWPLTILNNSLKITCVFSTPDSSRNVYKFPRNFINNKHWLPKWKKFRTSKIIKVDLPDFQKDEEKLNDADTQRSFFKERGLQPVRPWHEKPFQVFSLQGVIDQYIPPEGDGKLSPLNSAGAKQKLEWLKKKGRSWKDLRNIRKFDEDFDLYPDFVDKAQEIYIKAHELLAANDTDKLIDFVTEKAFPEIIFNSDRKTIRWKFLKSLEPPRVCHIRTGELFNKQNIFAQITVRFHTQQLLAIYDRFGRLMYGSETVAKDCLEYVVFEKYLSSLHGEWRVHHKIVPDWLPPRPPAPRTYILSQAEKESESLATAEPDTSDTVTSVPT